MKKRLRFLPLLALLLLATAVLSGCSLPQAGSVDLSEPPPGIWPTVTYALANVLVAIDDFLHGIPVPFISVNSWGWAIILFTLGIKVVTLPLTAKQLKSVKAQQELQPKLKEIQEKYGKDRQKFSEEQMKLYQEAGINPLGGCLPMLIQLPILWALYQALYLLAAAGELQNAPFFWIPDLSKPTQSEGLSWLTTAFQNGDWATLFAYLSLPVLMLVTQLMLQKMSQPPKGSSSSNDPQQRMMGQMMFLMPIMFGYITLTLPSGLTLYWTTSNILAMVQQYFLTGWGGLTSWLPFLGTKEPAVATTAVPAAAAGAVSTSTGSASVSTTSTSSTAELADPTKSPKRKRRRRS